MIVGTDAVVLALAGLAAASSAKTAGFGVPSFVPKVARSERFELPTLGFEVRCSIQLSYERINVFNGLR
jgi:hypothetical protein